MKIIFEPEWHGFLICSKHSYSLFLFSFQFSLVPDDYYVLLQPTLTDWYQISWLVKLTTNVIMLIIQTNKVKPTVTGNLLRILLKQLVCVSPKMTRRAYWSLFHHICFDHFLTGCVHPHYSFVCLLFFWIRCFESIKRGLWLNKRNI